jgi:hypothetical protein
MNATEVEPPAHGFTLHLGQPFTVLSVIAPATMLASW